MSPDAKHSLGAVLLWGGVAAAAIATAVLLAAPGAANLCLAGLIGGALVSVCGAYLKKRHCPSCRTGACPLPAPFDSQGK